MVGKRALAQSGSICASVRELNGKTLVACVVRSSVFQNSARGSSLDTNFV